jgi:hypothetical protein
MQNSITTDDIYPFLIELHYRNKMKKGTELYFLEENINVLLNLEKNVTDWLKQHDIDYKTKSYSGEFYFKKESDAVNFKLRFS